MINYNLIYFFPFHPAVREDMRGIMGAYDMGDGIRLRVAMLKPSKSVQVRILLPPQGSKPILIIHLLTNNAGCKGQPWGECPLNFHSCYIEPRLPRGGVYPPLVHTVERHRPMENPVRFRDGGRIIKERFEGFLFLSSTPQAQSEVRQWHGTRELRGTTGRKLERRHW